MDLFSQIEEPEREELLNLRKELEEANYKYYVLNMPTLSDREFDEKMHRLQALEAQFPDMFDPKSPTQHVGSDLEKPHPASPQGEEKGRKAFETVKHKYPMLSLANSYSREEIEDWVRKLPSGVEIVCELKYDGLSISLWYEHGQLVRALTRGDGQHRPSREDNAAQFILATDSLGALSARQRNPERCDQERCPDHDING